jgi:hypothetical protein
MRINLQKRVLPQLHGISGKLGTAISLLCETMRIGQDKKNNGQKGRQNEMLLPQPDFSKNTISTHRYQSCLRPRRSVTLTAPLQLSLTDFSARMEIDFLMNLTKDYSSRAYSTEFSNRLRPAIAAGRAGLSETAGPST